MAKLKNLVGAVLLTCSFLLPNPLHGQWPCYLAPQPPWPYPAPPMAYMPVAMPPAAQPVQDPIKPVAAPAEPPNPPADEPEVKIDATRPPMAELQDGPLGQPPGYWLTAGVDSLFLHPRFDPPANGFIDTTSSSTTFELTTFSFTTVRGPEQQSASPDYTGFAYAPRIWLGLVGPQGAGIRARYFHLDRDSAPITAAATTTFQLIAPPFPPPAQFVNQQTLVTSLEMHVLDIEATYERQFRLLRLLGSIGFRYVEVDRGESLTQFVPIVPGLLDLRGSALSRQAFQGWGPTIGVEARRVLVGRVVAYGSARGALLAGNTTNDTTGVPTLVFDQGPVVFPSLAPGTPSSTRVEDTLAIAEIQLGLEWTSARRRVEWLVRPVWEYQYWADHGEVIGRGGGWLIHGFGLVAGLRR